MPYASHSSLFHHRLLLFFAYKRKILSIFFLLSIYYITKYHKIHNLLPQHTLTLRSGAFGLNGLMAHFSQLHLPNYFIHLIQYICYFYKIQAFYCNSSQLCDILPPPTLTLRDVGFLFEQTIIYSLSRLSPYGPWFFIDTRIRHTLHILELGNNLSILIRFFPCLLIYILGN